MIHDPIEGPQLLLAPISRDSDRQSTPVQHLRETSGRGSGKRAQRLFPSFCCYLRNRGL